MFFFFLKRRILQRIEVSQERHLWSKMQAGSSTSGRRGVTLQLILGLLLLSSEHIFLQLVYYLVLVVGRDLVAVFHHYKFSVPSIKFKMKTNKRFYQACSWNIVYNYLYETDKKNVFDDNYFDQINRGTQVLDKRGRTCLPRLPF